MPQIQYEKPPCIDEKSVKDCIISGILSLRLENLRGDPIYISDVSDIRTSGLNESECMIETTDGASFKIRIKAEAV